MTTIGGDGRARRRPAVRRSARRDRRHLLLWSGAGALLLVACVLAAAAVPLDLGRVPWPRRGLLGIFGLAVVLGGLGGSVEDRAMTVRGRGRFIYGAVVVTLGGSLILLVLGAVELWTSGSVAVVRLGLPLALPLLAAFAWLTLRPTRRLWVAVSWWVSLGLALALASRFVAIDGALVVGVAIIGMIGGTQLHELPVLARGRHDAFAITLATFNAPLRLPSRLVRLLLALLAR